MSGIDGSILTALEQIDPEEAAVLEAEIEEQESVREEVEEDQVFDFEFDLY